MKATKRKDGRFEVKAVDPITRLRKSFYGNSEAEAIRKAKGILEDTLAEFYEQVYLPTVRMRSRNYRIQIAWAFDRHIAPYLGNAHLASLDRIRLQKHFNQNMGNLSPKSVHIVLVTLRSILALAEEDQIIERNPCLKIRTPEIPKKTQVTFTIPELWRLHEAADESMKPFILLASFAGLREGEALGSQWPKGDIVSIHQQVLQFGKGDLILTPKLKTKNAYREIPLPFVDLLGEPRVWICDNGDGGYLTPGQIAGRLLTACRRAKLPMIGPHALRHSFITNMEDVLEAPRRVVQELVGHGRTEMTDNYSKVSIETKRRWMQRYYTSTDLTTLSDDTSALMESKKA